MALGQVNIAALGGWPKKKVAEHRALIIHTTQTTVKTVAPGLIQAAIASYPRQPVSSGEFKRSWKFQNTPEGIVVYNPTVQASIIEHGRRPGYGVSREGRAAIARWVHLHGMDRGPMTRRERAYRRATGAALAGTGKFRERDIATRERRAMAIAFLIARAIKQRGMSARPILKPVRPLLRRVLVAAINKALAAAP